MTTDTQTPPDVSPYLGIPSAAKWAQRSEKTVRRAITAGRLPATQPSRRSLWSIHRRDLEAWVAAGCPSTQRDDAGIPPNVPTFEEVDPECATPESRAIGGGRKPSNPSARTAGADDEHPSAPAPGDYRERVAS